MNMVGKKAVRGDKLRDLLLFIYMNDRFSKDKIKVADLKKIASYSTGGAYSAFESPYIEKTGDEIHLTEEGKGYVKDRILPQYNVYKSYGNVLIFLGSFFLLQWFEWTYLKFPLIPSIYFAMIVLALGLFVRFFILRFNFYITKRRKKMTY
jgi:hypothetical protein